LRKKFGGGLGWFWEVLFKFFLRKKKLVMGWFGGGRGGGGGTNWGNQLWAIPLA